MGGMMKFHDLVWWQWAALPALVLGAWLGGLILGRVTRAVLGWLAKRTSTTWDDALIHRSAGPLTLAWTLAIISTGLPCLRRKR